MSQTLTYVIGSDRRALVDNIQDFKVDFGYDNQNWVQARQYERSMRQVFANIKNEDGTPFDLTGCNVWFEGILPDKTYKILDAKHAVILDATNGEFRFDMPKQAFAVAGSYQQAFFRIVRDGASVTTLEFDLEVLADKVISNLVARDYITPFEDLYDQLAAILAKGSGDVSAKIQDWNQKFSDKFVELTNLGATVTTTMDDVQNRLMTLSEKITQSGLFTQSEADKLKQEIEQKVEDNSYDNAINVKSKGAVGDGVTNDLPIFQKIINEGGQLFIPNGVYYFDGTLTPKDADTPVYIKGQMPGGVIIKSSAKDSIDLRESKTLYLENLTSDKGLNLVDYNGTDDGMTDRKITVSNVWSTSNSGKPINWDLLLTSAKQAEDEFANDHSGEYSRYPIEIYNAGGYNAININNLSQSVEASAIGITDFGGQKVPLSSPTILIDQRGSRAYFKAISKGSSYPMIEASGNTIAIASNVSSSDHGVANLKIAENTWPTIKLIERNSDSAASLIYNSNKLMLYVGHEQPVTIKDTGLETTKGMTVKTSGTVGLTIIRSTNDSENPLVKTFYVDNKGWLRLADGYFANPDDAGKIVQTVSAGPSSERPTLTDSSQDIGVVYFDRTVGKPIFWRGDMWVTSDGEKAP
ncbi:BppU family phage baseplate upper protein [Limosilactobacillus fermentum]|uniref:phage baseplate upper protein n=1 Tax=Limosilactobacillus fermentum TaxID=1613 RepID=UPI003F664E42